MPPQPEGQAALLDLPSDWKQIVRPLEPFLHSVNERLAKQIQAFDPELACYAEYALSSHGKQLRPALVGLTAGASGSLADAHVTVAVIIEMVHLATLVHDDVIDEATLRRGRPTLAANWGNELSVLLGDCLFAHALKLAASFPTPEVCRAVASATNTVCSGEILQSRQRQDFDVTRAEYLKVVSMKTGELFALSCDLGAYLSNAKPAWRALLKDYGLALGTAYQIFDDCLDLFGSEENTGKSLGTDLAKGKLTLPLLLVLERSTEADRAKLKKWMEHWDAALMPQVIALVDKYDALGQSCRIIRGLLQGAQQKVATLPPSASCAGLVGLAEFLAVQAAALSSSS